MADEAIVLSGRGLSKAFGLGRGRFLAVDSVDFDFRRGEIVSIVGMSGSGKTTLAKMILGLLNPTAGTVQYMGAPRRMRNHRERKAYWSHVQAIFQDPFASFNQFHKVERVLMDCLKMKGLTPTRKEGWDLMEHACTFVNLKFDELYNKYPFELSGGQMQRIMIARIFAISPAILIADEPTSMIDACSRSTILDMLLQLRKEEGMTIVFITHDLGLAYYVSDTVYIMEAGRVIERDTAEEVIRNPKTAYTRQLVHDVPKLNEEWKIT